MHACNEHATLLYAEAEKLSLSCDFDHQQRMSELNSIYIGQCNQMPFLFMDQVDYELAAARASHAHASLRNAWN